MGQPGLHGVPIRPTSAAVNRQYRRLTPDRRADHIAALALLGRLITQRPSTELVRRSFVVLTMPETTQPIPSWNIPSVSRAAAKAAKAAAARAPIAPR